MAKLPDSALVNIFTLQRNLVECLDSATAMEYRLLQQIGETPEMLPELEELQNIRERLVSSYSRLHNLLLRGYLESIKRYLTSPPNPPILAGLIHSLLGVGCQDEKQVISLEQLAVSS